MNMAESLSLHGATGFTYLLIGPKPVNIGDPNLQIAILSGAANTGAGIVAELLASKLPEPPVGSVWFSQAGGTWKHISAGTTTGTWALQTATTLISSKSGTHFSPQTGDVVYLFMAPNAGTISEWDFFYGGGDGTTIIPMTLKKLGGATISTDTALATLTRKALTTSNTFVAGDVIEVVVGTVSGTAALSLFVQVEF
jgi:hypothetical protein